jgi:hypothetical protein
VGAPLGKNLQPGTNHSGALYRCPMTTNLNDCEQVVTDGKRSKFVLAELPHLKVICPVEIYAVFPVSHYNIRMYPKIVLRIYSKGIDRGKLYRIQKLRVMF